MSSSQKGCAHPIARYDIFCETCYERVYCSEMCREIDMLEKLHVLSCKGLQRNPSDSPDVPYDVPYEEEEEEIEQRSGVISISPKRELFPTEVENHRSVLKKVKTMTETEDAVRNFFFLLPGQEEDDDDGEVKSPYLTPTQRVE